MTLLSDTQVSALQSLVVKGMSSTITVKRRTPVDSDYGDGDELSYVTVATTKGWFHSAVSPVQEVDSGSVITVTTHRLFVPLGTDVRDGDQIVVGTETYVVSDTNRETTWKAMLTCSLRKRD